MASLIAKLAARRPRNDCSPGDRSPSPTANESGVTEMRPARRAAMSVPQMPSASGMTSPGSPNRYSEWTSPSLAQSRTEARVVAPSGPGKHDRRIGHDRWVVDAEHDRFARASPRDGLGQGRAVPSSEAEVVRQPLLCEVFVVVDRETAGRRLLGQAQRGGSEDGRLEPRADGAGVGDVVGKVRPMVDAADDQVGIGRQAAEQSHANAVGRGSITTVDGMLAALYAPGADRPAEGAFAREAAAVAFRRDRDHAGAALGECGADSPDPGRLNPVVIGQQDTQRAPLPWPPRAMRLPTFAGRPRSMVALLDRLVPGRQDTCDRLGLRRRPRWRDR